MKTSCPKCGFTKEPLLSNSLYSVELVRTGESSFGLLFDRDLSDELLPVHYCHKCGFHLDDQIEADCSLCVWQNMHCTNPFSYVERSSLDILRGLTSRKTTHHTTLLIDNALDEDEHGPGCHAEANYCPACGKKWKDGSRLQAIIDRLLWR